MIEKQLCNNGLPVPLGRDDTMFCSCRKGPFLDGGGGYDTVSHPSVTIYEKPHAGERMGLMAYGPDKRKAALR